VISEAFKLLAARSNRIEQLRQKIAVGTTEIANGQMTDGEVVFERLQAKIDLILLETTIYEQLFFFRYGDSRSR
jgi:antitoxin ParD1/3/4